METNRNIKFSYSKKYRAFLLCVPDNLPDNPDRFAGKFISSSVQFVSLAVNKIILSIHSASFDIKYKSFAECFYTLRRGMEQNCYGVYQIFFVVEENVIY